MDQALELSQDRRTSFQFFGPSWSYQGALELQETKVASLKEDEFFCLSGLHDNVYTLGYRLKDQLSFVKAGKTPVVLTSRGGQIMYHGEGQLTMYFIFKLRDYFSGPRAYADFLFRLLMDYFKKEMGLSLTCKRNGLWLNDKKVVFMGLRLKNKVVYHGISINFLTDTAYFKRLSPCDTNGVEVGNLLKEPVRVDYEAHAKAIFEDFITRIDKSH